MSIARRGLLASLAFTAVVALSAAYLPAQAQAKKELVLGATAGPYADQIRFGIKPILEARGYRVKLVEFNDYIQPNFALAQGDLDANAFQHVVYLTRFATENKLALSELIKVPTAPIAVYSHRHKSLAEVKEGATVALPNDPTNAARALNVVAVRTADKDAPWVRDIAEAYRSREFLAVTESRFAGFVKTDYQQALTTAAAK